MSTLQAFLDPRRCVTTKKYGTDLLSTLHTADSTLPHALGPPARDQPSVVKPSPPLPGQITVDDSYVAALYRTGRVIRGQTVELKLLGGIESRWRDASVYEGNQLPSADSA
jgi:hypothetical protein